MKANELIIGDWVIAQPDEDICGEGVGTIVDRVTEIYDVEGVLSVTLEDFDYPIAVGLLDPFPLTAEILEKNGFKRHNRYQYIHKDNYSKVCVSIPPRIEIDGMDMGEPPICVDIEGALFDINISISAIHELQHALRLCGIDKEIVI